MFDPVDEKYRRQMNNLARQIDRRFNGSKTGTNRTVGFALLVYDFGAVDGQRMNYIGNGDRDDIKIAMRELLARWDGMRMPDGGHA